MSCEEMRELITGLVDNEISTEEHMQLQQHLDQCRDCRNAVTLERRMKVRTREAGAHIVAPAELKLALRRKYGSQRGSLWARLQTWLQMGLRPVPVVALVLLILIPLAFFVIDSPRPVPVATLETHRAVDSGALDYPKVASPDLLAQELSRAVGNRFMPPVYDLKGFGLRTAGGFQQKVRDRDVLVTVYRGNGDTLTCHTFLGDETDIPQEAELISNPLNGRKYFTFSDGLVNGVLQRYGDEVCVLVSALPMDELIRIARSVHPPNHG